MAETRAKVSLVEVATARLEGAALDAHLDAARSQTERARMSDLDHVRLLGARLVQLSQVMRPLDIANALRAAGYAVTHTDVGRIVSAQRAATKKAVKSGSRAKSRRTCSGTKSRDVAGDPAMSGTEGQGGARLAGEPAAATRAAKSDEGTQDAAKRAAMERFRKGHQAEDA